MKILSKMCLALFTTLAIIGCGSSGGGSTSTSVTGQFVDDPVENLNYACSSGIVDVTNSSGEYTCDVDDNVTFSIGIVTIGTIAAQNGVITPYSLFPDDLNAALNLARLLQSLDSSSKDDIIILDLEWAEDLPTDLNFSSATFETEVETALDTSLPSSAEAQEELNQGLINAGEEVPDVDTVPIADAGADQNVDTSSEVTLDGSGSSDADAGDTLTYLWSFISYAGATEPSLSDATAENPTFTTASADGSYVLQLIVNDGTIDSAPTRVLIAASTPVSHNGLDYRTIISPYTGKTWLDRNVGASQVCTSTNDTGCYGGYYQWGRDTDGHEIATSAVQTSLATTLDNVGSNFISTVIAPSPNPHDWIDTNHIPDIDDSGELRKAKWSKTDGSSVCPVGYRVPTLIEIENETASVSNPANAYSNFLKLPSAGSRNTNGSTTIYDTTVTLWTSDIADERIPTTSMYRNFSSYATSGDLSRAKGFSVRCIKN